MYGRIVAKRQIDSSPNVFSNRSPPHCLTCLPMRLLHLSLLAVLFFLSIAHAAPVSLFDGKTLDGWEGDLQWWSVKENAITGGSTTQKIPHNFFLATTRSYHNFDLHLKIKVTGDPATGMINSGIQLRSLRVPNHTEMSGYQVDAGEGWWGKLYDESRRNKVISEAANLAAVQAAVTKDGWNEFRILTTGPRIQTWINGVQALDYTETDPNIALDGKIAIQIHSGGIAQVQVKDITIEELPATPGAPTWDQVGHPTGKKPNASASSATLKEGNALSVTAKTPQEQLTTFKLPEGFEIELVAAEDPAAGIGKFIAVHFDNRGRMWSMTALEYPVDGNENPAAADALYQSHAKDKILVFDTPFAPGPQKPRVFADGLAIPLGILPYQDGCYALHGPDIVYLKDSDNDGKADQRETILTGFGVQDSHLFPHQFTRAPGGYLWFAQGAFNYSKVRRPHDAPERAIQFDQTRMAKFRPDGSGFDITSNGPCNIWGLVLTGQGESFIQEANDFGYAVMPFHEYANYPGCSNQQWKSYAPEFPSITNFRLGGTGLSGLALTDAKGAYPAPWADVMLVANPITRRINAIKLHRDGPNWRAEPLPDFVESTDEMFRPVALTLGPDGCVYIVDWYNKIISHNEVPRNHPERDKIRGRIWRIKAKNQTPHQVPDFTKLRNEALLAKLGDDSLTQSHLAWQTIIDQQKTDLAEDLRALIENGKRSPAASIQALWALEGLNSPQLDHKFAEFLYGDPNRNVRREIIRVMGNLTHSGNDYSQGIPANGALSTLAEAAKDPDPEVRAETARVAGLFFNGFTGKGAPLTPEEQTQSLQILLSLAEAPLATPTAPSSHRAQNIIKIGPAYEREFQRYLVRLALEKQPQAVTSFLDSPAASQLPVEAQLLAALSLEPQSSATRVARLLPQLQRRPELPEILRLVEYVDQPGVINTLHTALANSLTRNAVLEALLQVRSRIDTTPLIPLLTQTAIELFDTHQTALALDLASGFKLTALEPHLIQLVRKQDDPDSSLGALRALAEIGSHETTLFIDLIKNSDNEALRDAALLALTNSKSSDATPLTLQLWTQLSSSQRRLALTRLATSPNAARSIVTSMLSKTISTTDFDASLLERLQVLLPDDPELASLLQSTSSLFRDVLVLDGSENAWTQTDLNLDGPITIETWIRLDPDTRKPGNSDGIFGAPGQLDLNFFASRFRVYTFPPVRDAVVSEKPITPGMWTHVAATRDAQGIWRLYQDGEPAGTSNKPAPGKITNPRIGWTTASGGTRGAMAAFRVWNVERTNDQIRSTFDRGLPDSTPNLILNPSSDHVWGKLQSGAKIAKTSDIPPVLTEGEATTLDAKFAKYRNLASKPGNVEAGKLAATICMGCHLIKAQGNHIGPDLSGVGAMGTEAILRNILTPNAAMESAYHLFRVELKDGTVREGFQAGEDDQAVILRTVGAEDQRIRKSDIRESRFLRRSLMPEGLIDALTDQQVSDLFAYLRSLK
jgi:putative membrane-bound dehydrogenase-like protein